VRKLFETHDRLAELDPSGLLDRRLRPTDDAVVAQEMRFRDGEWRGESVTLRLESGLPFSAELDQSTVRLIRALDGTKTLGEALATAVSSDEVETGAALARQMLAVGFLDFAD
jgi:hypothetical protein